jgi:hyperosmotically inducible protein
MKSDLRAMIRMLLLISLFGVGLLAKGQDQVGQSPAPQPDNTKTNQRDRSPSEPTADQQKAGQSDRDITQRIRKSIVKDKSLSMYAHNVKVITQNGAVTLKGPVRSDEEKKTVEQKAAEVAGADKVTSEIDVQPKQ